MNKNKTRYPQYSKEYRDAKTYIVRHDSELLEYLYELFPQSSKSSVKSLLKSHKVSISGSPITQFDFQLYKDDEIIITKEPIAKKERKNLPIIFENEDLIVIDKPTKLLSVASDKEKGLTAFRLVNDYVQQKDKHNRVFVVHRLDEDTSGVLLFAKSSLLQKAFQDNWNNLVKKRGYYAIIEGTLKEKEATLKNHLKMNNLNLMYVTHEDKNSQLAITHYKVIKESDKYSLLDVHIETGRKNQIRVQLGQKGHYVIGDDKYGHPKNPINRLGLHAYELEIIHPFSEQVLKFKAPMPKEFKSLMDGTYVPLKRTYKKK